MKQKRIGNDIRVAWSIYRDDDSAFSIEGLNVSLYLKSIFGRKKQEEFVVAGNTIQWTFYGKDQTNIGKYSLELVINEGDKGMITLDSPVFVKLIVCTCQSTEGEDESGIETETIELKSKLDVLSGEAVNIIIDEVLSETSINPVQNKVITAELNKKIDGETLEQRISREHIYFYYVVIENKVYYKGYNVNEMTELQPWLLNFVVGLPITPHLLILDNEQNVNISSNKFEITTNPLGLQWQYDDLQYTLVFNNGQVITTTAIPSGGNGDANVAAIDSVGEVEDPSFDVDEKLAELSADVSKKQDTITDLETIRSGAAKGATALQSVPATYATKTDVSNAIAAAITTTLNEEV
jgi:hypothetical protein